jgi:SP family sugar:H+ symporter-like MFS transporter
LRGPIALCIATSFAGFIFGWDVGTIGGISNFQGFKRRFGNSRNPISGEPEFNSLLIGLIIAVFNAGCAIGGLTLPKLSDIKGRKFTIFLSVWIYVLGLLVQTTSRTSGKWYQFLIGRIITGFAVGSTSVLTPMFISESAPLRIRGSMVVFYQVMITAGILLGNLANFGCKQNHANTDAEWLIPVALGFVWAFLIYVGTYFMPESAVFKINRNDDIQGAKESIAKLNNISVDSEICQREVDKLIDNKRFVEEQTNNVGEWHEFITGKPKLGFRLAIGIFVMFFQQFSGANYFFYYGTSLFSSVGIDDSYITAIILATVNFGSTFFGIYLVEKLGRKSCLLYGSALMFVSMLVYASLGSFALLNQAGEEKKSVGGLMIFVTCLYIVGFATTWGPVAFVVVSEIFPVKVKATSMAISTSINWTSNFLISLFTPFITSKIGFKLGFVFAGCLLASVFFVQICVPETKGLRIEEVDEIFRENKRIIHDDETD